MTPDINKLLKADPRPMKYGAPLGDSGFIADNPGKLLLQRVRLIDGDYGSDGTYWGGSMEHIWCAFNTNDGEHAPAQGTRLYVRAGNRADAIKKFSVHHPSLTFIRGAS